MALIESGEARICLVGGFDDFGEEGSYEFGQMRATSSSVADALAGREPLEASRPTSSTRAGFVESAGAGVQFLCSAELAVAMGVPVYGVVGMVRTAMDGAGRSVPAPGQGVLTTAGSSRRDDSDSNGDGDSDDQWTHPMLSVEFRRTEMARARAEVDAWRQERAAAGADSRWLDEQHARRVASLHADFGNFFHRRCDAIAPLEGALAVWGLTVDDVEVGSLHGTGTKLNDTNECHVLQQQMSRLGRKKGNAMMAVCQKSVTGHPKGAAAAWMLNGLVQSMMTKIVPVRRIDLIYVVFLNCSLGQSQCRQH